MDERNNGNLLAFMLAVATMHGQNVSQSYAKQRSYVDERMQLKLQAQHKSAKAQKRKKK